MRPQMMTRIAVAAALAACMELYGGVKIPALFPGFLKVDMGDLLPLAVALTMGFRAGLWTEVLKVLIHMTLKGGNLLGNSANLTAGIAFLLPVAFLTIAPRTRRQALLPLVLGPICAALVMWPANAYVFLPLRGIQPMAAQAMALGTLVPFNLFKFGLSAVAVYAVLPTLVAYLGAAPIPHPSVATEGPGIDASR